MLFVPIPPNPALDRALRKGVSRVERMSPRERVSMEALQKLTLLLGERAQTINTRPDSAVGRIGRSLIVDTLRALQHGINSAPFMAASSLIPLLTPADRRVAIKEFEKALADIARS